MASVWKHPKSPFWTACWRDAEGKQRRVSTKTSDRNLARRIAREFEAATRKKRTLHQLEKVLRTFHEELCGEASQSRSLRSFGEEWLAEKRSCVADSTFKFYHATASKLYAYFGERADQPISEITRAELVGFRNRIAAELSASTTNHDVTVVRMIFADARRRGVLAENPAESIKSVREREDPNISPPRRAFTIAELQSVLALADPEWQSMIRIGLYCGGRLGDVACLRWSNIDMERGELRFTARKTAKAVCVPIGEGPLREVLLSLPASDEPGAYLHPRAAAKVTKRGSSANLSQEFAGLLKLAGLRPGYQRRTPEAGGTSRRHQMSSLSFHSLRHTAVSLLKDAGIPQAVVQELVGHSSAQMSAVYTHVGSEALQRAAASLPTL